MFAEDPFIRVVLIYDDRINDPVKGQDARSKALWDTKEGPSWSLFAGCFGDFNLQGLQPNLVILVCWKPGRQLNRFEESRLEGLGFLMIRDICGLMCWLGGSYLSACDACRRWNSYGA